MKQIGITEQGQPVVDGVFKLCDTIGLPLDIIVEELRDRNITVAWDVFILDAKQAGWKEKTIQRKLDQVDVVLPNNEEIKWNT